MLTPEGLRLLVEGGRGELPQGDQAEPSFIESFLRRFNRGENQGGKPPQAPMPLEETSHIADSGTIPPTA